MLENSFGILFYLKVPRNESKIRNVYLRITVDGIRKEASTKHQWDMTRWDPKAERAAGNKEDAKSLNFFLDSLAIKIITVAHLNLQGDPGAFFIDCTLLLP